MSEEKDFFKTCFNTVAGLEVTNESQAIAKEVVEKTNLKDEKLKISSKYNKIIIEKLEKGE